MEIGRSYPSRYPQKGAKREAVDAMLELGSAPELKGPTPEQRETLHANLGRMDQGVLLWASQQGVRLQVLQEGQELDATEALRDLSGRFEERMKPDVVAQVHEHLAPLTERIRTEKDADRALSLRRQKRAQLAEILTLNACGAAVFTPAFAPLLAPGLSKLMADPTETPTLKSMALHHGADSPQEQQQFYSWMETLNGERLEKAREATIEERSRLLKSRPEALQAWLRQANEQPETVPLDATLHTLVVPDAHYFSSGPEKEPLLIDRSDIRSVEGWRNEEFRGQWFFLEGKANLLIRDSAVSLDTPIHEMGHVVDMTLERDEPEFYKSLSPRIERAYSLARSQNRTVSNYSRANRREYIAEGFAAYYGDPDNLKQVDPELYELVDQMVGFCCQKVGLQPDQ